MYLIHPAWIYLVSLTDNLLVVCAIAVALTLVATIILVCAYMSDDFMDEEEKRIKKAMRVSLIIFILSLLIVIFVPDKKTIIEMFIAKNVTIENAQIALDSIKNATDYVVSAIGKIG